MTDRITVHTSKKKPEDTISVAVAADEISNALRKHGVMLSTSGYDGEFLSIDKGYASIEINLFEVENYDQAKMIEEGIDMLKRKEEEERGQR